MIIQVRERPEWQGVFYPKELKQKQWLDFYAKHFGFCELNFSYYRMPQGKQLEKYLEYPLKYAIKGHRSLTHDRVEYGEARIDFLNAVSVLQQDDHLAAVLLQFPEFAVCEQKDRLMRGRSNTC